MNNREAFEAWYQNSYVCFGQANFHLNSYGEYFDDDIEASWCAWQAAIASQAQQPTQEPYGWHIKGLENAGMRYFFTVDKIDAEYWQGHGMTLVPVYLQSQAHQTDSRWRPIATAPKNKKIIVRYKNVCDKERTVFAKYIEEFTEETNSETECETDYHEERDTYYLKEGWVEMIDNWDEFSCVYFDSRNVPTHWMPLPPAPEGD